MTRDELRAALQNANVRAFLRVIREGESSQDDSAYTIQYGGKHFEGFADHPRNAISAGGITSTAAGAYQFLERTWDNLVRQYGFPDFSPACQDEAAVALIAGRKALNALIDGDLPAVLDRCSWEWASLPPSRYGQSVLDAGRVYATYAKWGGVLAAAAAPSHPVPEQQPAAPIREAVPPILPPEKKMPAPFIIPAFEILSSMLPTLIRKFGKTGSETAERNAQVAEVVVGVAKEALGAKNEQEVIERITADPTALQTVDRAVAAAWLDITEAGGGGIAGARAFNLAAADKPIFHQPSFIVSLVLLLFPLLLVIDVFFVHSSAYNAELRTQIVTAILVVIGMVGGFWLGSSMSSRNKDDALARAIK